MSAIRRIAVIVPAFNEEQAISDVVHAICQVASTPGFSIDAVVINDCSTDNTAAIIDQLPCTALHLPINLGIGGAVQTGIKYAFENGYDLAVQIDGDGQHPPVEIPTLALFLEAHNLDVVIGSRFLEKEGFQSSSMRRNGIRFFRFFIRLMTGLDIKDNTSGFRMMNRKTMAEVIDYYPDEYPEPETIVLYARKGLKVGEVAVKMRERQGGTSSINNLNSIYYMVKVTIAILFTRIRTNKK
jgi:glycosyltransferase involved in cell wall biosynthesis